MMNNKIKFIVDVAFGMYVNENKKKELILFLNSLSDKIILEIYLVCVNRKTTNTLIFPTGIYQYVADNHTKEFNSYMEDKKVRRFMNK